MRGLDIRIDYVRRKLQLTYRPADEVELWVPLEDATALGVYEYGQGREDVPLLFVGEPDLVSAWAVGQHFAWESAELAACSGCQDPDIPLCPVHD